MLGVDISVSLENPMAEELYAGTCSICVGAVCGATIVEVAGEIDVATVSLLAKALGDAIQSGRGDLVMDAQNLTYIDSAGIQTLISTQEKLATQGRRMAVVGCHGIFHKLMSVSMLEGRFPTYSTVDEALMSLNAWDMPTV